MGNNQGSAGGATAAAAPAGTAASPSSQRRPSRGDPAPASASSADRRASLTLGAGTAGTPATATLIASLVVALEGRARTRTDAAILRQQSLEDAVKKTTSACAGVKKTVAQLATASDGAAVVEHSKAIMSEIEIAQMRLLHVLDDVERLREALGPDAPDPFQFPSEADVERRPSGTAANNILAGITKVFQKKS